MKTNFDKSRLEIPKDYFITTISSILLKQTFCHVLFYFNTGRTVQ